MPELDVVVVVVEAAAEIVEAAAADVVAAALAAALEAVEVEPVDEPAMTLPWSSTAATAEKSVLIPKTALNASA